MKNDSQETYNSNSQNRFKTMMFKSDLWDHSDSYILVKGTITVPKTAAAGAAANNANKEVIIKNCAPFADCMSEISKTQVDNAKGIDVVMSICNLIECNEN